MSLLYLLFPKSNNAPRWLIFFIDIAICIFSYVAAIALRFNFFIEDLYQIRYFYALPLVLGVRIIFILYFRIYAGIIRHTSVQDAIRVFYTTTFSTLTIGIINFSYAKINPTAGALVPLSILIIDYIGTTLLMNAFRLATKVIYIRISRPDDKLVTNYAIFGAGESGIITKKKLEQNSQNIEVVAFFDDDLNKHKQYVDGVFIYNGKTELEEIIRKLNINELIISTHRLPKLRKQEVIETCLSLDIKVRTVPPSVRWINGELSFNQIKSVKIEDLIERDEIVLDKGAIARQLFGKTIIVTGAAGSIGSELVRQILNIAQPKKLILIDKSEAQLFELETELTRSFQRAFNNFTEILIGDITNISRMESIFRSHKPDIVYHAAAYKHVPLMEYNPGEAVRVNVGGTKVLADLALKYNTEKFVMVSTDKAVNPTNVMGASKRIAEMYVQSLSNRYSSEQGNTTKFITTRFGNVLGSSGSVLPLFKKQIDDGGPVTVTHPDVTRYFMTISEACQLVLEAGNMGNGGEIYIFDMGQSIKIIHLAKKMIQLSGLKLGSDIQIIFTGLRPGEKIKEELLADQENCVPTHHPKIMIAKIREYSLDWITIQIHDLLELYALANNEKLVAKMKAIVPEYISNNSSYEILDINSLTKQEN
ncbi:MAG: polysaccharide biosynthesis protein [Bacteroidota bacterium]